MSHTRRPSVIVKISQDSKEVVDLAKVLDQTEASTHISLAMASKQDNISNFVTASANSSPDEKREKRQFFRARKDVRKNQLDAITLQAKPYHHGYWFRKAYSFYSQPSNNHKPLDEVLNQLISELLQPLSNTYISLEKNHFAEFNVKTTHLKTTLLEKFQDDLTAADSFCDYLTDKDFVPTLVLVAKKLESLSQPKKNNSPHSTF